MRLQPQQNCTVIPIYSMNKYYNKYTLQTKSSLKKYNFQWYICDFAVFKESKICNLCISPNTFFILNNFFSSSNWSIISSKQKILAKNWQSENIMVHRILCQATFFKLLLIFFQNWSVTVKSRYSDWVLKLRLPLYYLTDIRAPR